MNKKGFGVSPLTNTIYYGTQNKEKNMFTGKKIDVTNEVIGVCFEWFLNNIEAIKTEEYSAIKTEEYSITYPNTEYELLIRKKRR